jgi:hypothetical protein
MQLPSEREVYFATPESKSSPKSDELSVLMPPPTAPMPVPPAETAASASPSGPASAPRWPPPVWWKPALERVRHNPRVALISAGGFVLLIVVAIVAVIPRQAPVQPLVATAVAGSTSAFLYKDASVAATIVGVAKGERVNILKMPLSRDQVWVRAQFISSRNHKVYGPGYMRVSDLEGWDSANADYSLALIRMFDAGDSSETKDQAELPALESLISRFPSTRAARQANIEAAKLDLAASQALKDSGQPPSTWQSRLDSARAHLAATSDDPSLTSDVDPLRRQLEALAADSAAPGSVPGRAQSTPAASSTGPAPTIGPASQPNSERLSKKKIETLLAEAESFWDQRNFDEAEKRVKRVLNAQKDNPRALELQEKLRKRKELLEKY